MLTQQYASHEKTQVSVYPTMTLIHHYQSIHRCWKASSLFLSPSRELAHSHIHPPTSGLQVLPSGPPFQLPHTTIDLCRGFLLLLPSPPTFLMHPCHPLSGHCALRCRQWTVWVPQDHYQATLAQLLFCLQPHLAHQITHLLHDAFQK